MTDIDFDAVIAELRKGWKKRSPRGGETCLLGALARVTGEEHWSSEQVVHAASHTLLPSILEQFEDRVISSRRRDDRPGDAVWRFNDHPDTTLDDVILVCEKARAAQGEIR